MAIIDKPSDYFNTVLYTGNATVRSISGVGFQPDLVWIKNRTQAVSHLLFDSIRGATNRIYSDLTAAEDSNANSLTSFDSDGFSLGTAGSSNGNTNSIVSWNWKAGTSFTNDASATGIGSIDSAGSASDASGFSIVSYTGTGSAGTIKHGLSTTPKMIIQKNRDESQPWWTYVESIGAGGQLRLNGTNAAGSDGGVLWNSTAPTSSVFSVGDNTGTNGSADKCIAYCFSEVKGYSKFGSYTGNGSASSGTFTYLGFKPSLIILKRTDSTADWKMYDNKRNSGSITNGNPNGRTLKPNSSAAEGNAELLDFLSNGFKHYNDNGTDNESGATYIFMAFAENPFVTSTGIPATAR